MSDRASCEEQIMKSAAPIIAGSAVIGGIAGGALAVKLAAPVVVPMTVASVAASALVGGASLSGTAYALTADNRDPQIAKGAAALAGTVGMVAGTAIATSPAAAVFAVGAAAGGGLLGGGTYLVANAIAKLSCRGEKASLADASEVLPPLATPVAAAPAKGPVRS